MTWTPELIEEICEYFNRTAEAVTPGWAERKYPVGIKESKCRAA